MSNGAVYGAWAPTGGGPLRGGLGAPGGTARGSAALVLSVYRGHPPEWWERLSAAYRGWWARHLRFARNLCRTVWALYAIAIPLGIIALIVIPRLAVAMVPPIFAAMGLVLITMLARTRTIGWRAISAVYGIGIWSAVATALATRWIGGLGGLSPSDDGARVTLAAFIEEPAKLVVLVLLAVLAPGRVRRFAAVDWALLGFASGLGFTVAEDSVRRLGEPGLWERVLGEERFHYSPNPWTIGSYSSEMTDGLAVGHQVHTMTVAMAIGLAIALWRIGPVARTPLRVVVRRAAALALPVLALLQMIADHAGWNGNASLVDWSDARTPGVPGWIPFLWSAGSEGSLSIPVSVLMLVVCLLVDAYRRACMGVHGFTVGDAPAVRFPVIELPAPLRAAMASVMALAQFTWSDMVVVFRAYGDRRWGTWAAMRQGSAMGVQVRGVRADAMGRGAPGREPRARWLFRLWALLCALLLVGVCWWGLMISQEVGEFLTTDGDGMFFAGLLEMLAEWWDGLGMGGQILLTALGVLLIMASGGSFALAMGATGILTWVAAHGAGLGSLLRDPAAAIKEYLSTATPEKLVLDIVDFALTFVPGSFMGRAGHATAETLAKTRAMREKMGEAAEWAARGRAASESGAARRAAEAAAERRAARHGASEAEDLRELESIFEDRARKKAALDANISELETLANKYGLTASDFTRDKMRDSIHKLRRSGADPRDVDNIKDFANAASGNRRDVIRAAEYAGERGGEQYLSRQGFDVPDSFHSNPVQRVSGRGQVDGLAVSRNGDEVVVPEYKGGTGEYRPNKTYGLKELSGSPAAQGAPDYVMDRMLSDERVARYFYDHPDLWQSVMEGRTRLRTDVLTTPSAGATSSVHSEYFVPTQEFIDKMSAKIANVGGH